MAMPKAVDHATAERNDEWSALVRPEVILPAQFFGALRRQRPCQGERRLMLAILEDAINCFQKYHDGRRSRERRLFCEAEEWLLSADRAPFSFEHVCGVFDFDPAYIREGLQQWSDRQLAQRSFELSALNPGAASTRAAPAANRPPLSVRASGRSTPGVQRFCRVHARQPATESYRSEGVSFVPSRLEPVNAERANSAVAGRRLRSA